MERWRGEQKTRSEDIEGTGGQHLAWLEERESVGVSQTSWSENTASLGGDQRLTGQTEYVSCKQKNQLKRHGVRRGAEGSGKGQEGCWRKLEVRSVDTEAVAGRLKPGWRRRSMGIKETPSAATKCVGAEKKTRSE